MDKTAYMWAKIDRLDARITELEERVKNLLTSLQEYESSLDILLVSKTLEAKIVQLERELEDVKVAAKTVKLAQG